MPRREFHRHRILNLAIGKNSMEKTIAKSIYRPLNAVALDKIDTSTNDTHWRIVGRLTRSLPLARSRDLPVHVARLPPAPFCKTFTLGVRRGERPTNLHIGTIILDILPSQRAFLSRQYQAQPKQRAIRWRD